MNSLWPTSEKITTLSEIITHKPQLLTTLLCRWYAWQPRGSLHRPRTWRFHYWQEGGGATCIKLCVEAEAARLPFSCNWGVIPPLGREFLIMNPDRQPPSGAFQVLWVTCCRDGIWTLGIDMEAAVYTMAIQGIKSGSHYVEFKTNWEVAMQSDCIAFHMGRSNL